jgi:hypothetical protein
MLDMEPALIQTRKQFLHDGVACIDRELRRPLRSELPVLEREGSYLPEPAIRTLRIGHPMHETAVASHAEHHAEGQEAKQP